MGDAAIPAQLPVPEHQHQGLGHVWRRLWVDRPIDHADAELDEAVCVQRLWSPAQEDYGAAEPAGSGHDHRGAR